MVFPVTTIDGHCCAILMRHQQMVVDKDTVVDKDAETLLSVSVLLKACVKVIVLSTRRQSLFLGFDGKFVTGTKKDALSGYLVTPDGQKIRMVFGDTLCVLMCSDPVRYTGEQVHTTIRTTSTLVPNAAALDALSQPSLDREAIQLDTKSTTFGAVLSLGGLDPACQYDSTTRPLDSEMRRARGMRRRGNTDVERLASNSLCRDT